MTIILDNHQAAALRHVLKLAILEKDADARLNGWVDKDLPALRATFVQLNAAITGKAQP